MACSKKEIKKLSLVIFAGLAAFSFVLPASASKKSAPFHVKWVTKLKKEKLITRRPYQFASPLATEDVIYAGTASGYIYALDTKSGRKIWHTKLAGGVYSEPAADASGLYIADRKGIVYALDKKGGGIEWRVETGAEISARPLLTDDTIYVATVLKQVIALSRSGTGKKWQTARFGTIPQMTIKGSSPPVLHDGKIFVGFSDGMLFCFSADDGAIVWAKQLSDKNAQFVDVDSAPVIKDDVIYVSSMDGKTYALNPNDGGIKWVVNKGGPNDPLVDEGYVYISGGGRLSKVSADTGLVLWEQDFEEPELSAPVLRNGFLTLVSSKDKLYVVDAESGDVRFQRFLGKGSFGRPVMLNGAVYILTNSSRMFALQGL